MTQLLTQTTKPGEIYVRLGHMIKSMSNGDRMPPIRRLKEPGTTQRSLDMAYERFKADGVLEIKKQSGVFVKNPYAGGTFLFAAAEDYFLSYKSGENMRLYFAELRQKIHHYFPDSRLEIVLSESPDLEYYDREPQLRRQLVRANEQNRILGAFVSYHIVEQATIDLFNELDIPVVDINGGALKIHNPLHDIRTMVAYLQQAGMKKIAIISSKVYDSPELRDYLSADKNLSFYPMTDHIENHDLIACGINYIKELLASNIMPEAFAIMDDYICQGMLTGAYMKGVHLEQQYGMITLSQRGFLIHTEVPLAYLNYCWDEIAGIASSVMLKKLRKEKMDQPAIVLPTIEFGA